ncbi:MAG TPA: glycyl-radical enzyme activating protein [Geobacteraceae bacterium]
MKQQYPLILHIRRFALDDGPGIRSTVFLKGCPLSCAWCHNPESIARGGETAYFPASCIDCGECRNACPRQAITDNPLARIDRTRCSGCGRCADICPALALKRMGKHIPVDELLALLLRDRHFYEHSGGGVTFSGGEPTLHFDYLCRTLRRLKEMGIHTALQTCGLFDADRFVAELLPHIDLIHFDLKLMDPRLHRRYTGRNNDIIMENFTRLTRAQREKIVPRIPLVPGITATPANLLGIAAFLRGLGYRSAELLPYNPAGIDKLSAIGRKARPGLAAAPLTRQEEDSCRYAFSRALESGPKHSALDLQPSA